MEPDATPAPRLFSVGAGPRYTSGIADAASLAASAIGDHRKARDHASLSTQHEVSVPDPACRQRYI